MSALRDDWKEFLAALAARKVDDMVVGGVAVGVHGHVRYTKDLDVWFRGTEENAQRLVAALEDFGFATVPVPLAEFCKPRGMLVLGSEPNAIELINFADGVDFDECFRRRVVFVLGEAEVAVIGLDDLRANKRAVGRLQDLADLESLDEVPDTNTGNRNAEN
jgi:hypothetical protein